MWKRFFGIQEIMFLREDTRSPHTISFLYKVVPPSLEITIKLNYTFIAQLSEGFFPTFWRPLLTFLKVSSQLSEGIFPNFWRPLPNFLKASSELSEGVFPTFWRPLPNFLKAFSQLSEGFFPTLWGDQVRRLRRCIEIGGLPVTGCSTGLGDIASLPDL